MNRPNKTTTSERPRQFARLRVENLIGRNRFKRTEKEIALSLNYSPETAKRTHIIKSSKAYQEETAKVSELMEKERFRALEAMKRKNLNSVKYHQISEVVKNLTHNIQLIGGKETERTGSDAGEQLAALIKDIRQIHAERRKTIQEREDTA